MSAWIYILEHKSGTTVKVGETRVSPDNRLRDYSKTYGLKGFKVYKTFPVPEESRKKLEEIAHSKLKEY